MKIGIVYTSTTPELIETAHITTSITVNKDPDFISYYPQKNQLYSFPSSTVTL